MKNNIEFANITITTEDNKVLIDIFQDMVLPAFLNGYQRETHFNTTYIFDNCGVQIIKRRRQDEVVIFGRFIKNEELTREQYYDRGRLIADKQSMASSPSSIFALTLTDHKVIYFRETDDAPGIEAFGNTLAYFMKQARIDFVQKIVDDYKQGKEVPSEYLDPKLNRPTKKHLFDLIKKPTVKVLYLPSSQSMTDFIRSFEVINLVEAEVEKTNHELDFSDLIEGVQKEREGLKADTGLVRFYSKEGMNKKAAEEVIRETGNSGSAKLKVKGLGRNGQQINGNHERFKVSINLAMQGSAQPQSLFTTLVDSYDSLVENKAIKPATVDTPVKKVREVIDFIRKMLDNKS